jgi:hypothetical protein
MLEEFDRYPSAFGIEWAIGTATEKHQQFIG